MLHSTYYHKDTNEDPKTSSIFENLMLLPDNIFWDILRISCFNGEKLPELSGTVIGYGFWPHWDKSGTTNSKYVEPDVFLRFKQFDIIIEAKYGDLVGQYKQQWINEIKAYLNEYGKDKKDVYFIAIGGNSDLAPVKQKVKDKEVEIYKCSWLSLLINVTNYQKQIECLSMIDETISSRKRILENIKLAFNINGVYNINWFNDLLNNSIHIDSNSINILKDKFNYE